MERDSDKHGAPRDEALAREVDGTTGAGRSSRSEQWLEPEPSGEDQPNMDLRPHGGLPGGVPEGMTDQDVEPHNEAPQALVEDGSIPPRVPSW